MTPTHALRLGGYSASVLVVLVTTSVMVALAVAPADAKRPPTCTERGGRTITRTHSVRVFVNEKTANVYGCHFRARRPFFLGTDSGSGSSEDGVCPLRLVGPLVAYNSFFSDGRQATFADEQDLRVKDLRTGRVLRAVDYRGSRDDNAIERIRDIELKASGSLAWILEIRTFENGVVSARSEVHRADGPLGRTPKSANEVIDSGPGIRPESLSLRGDTLSWVKDGQVVTAPVL